MKTIVCGSRGFNDYATLEREMLLFHTRHKVSRVLSGTARGADRLGERWAQANGIDVDRYPALWVRHGKAAGVMRNVAMIQRADAMVAFWDGASPGTLHAITQAKHFGLLVNVVKY